MTAASLYGGGASKIFRFPPNFVRQLNTKARRNCGNIGVAQVVAASWSNNSASGSAAAAAASGSAATAAAVPTAPVELTTGDEVGVVDGFNNVQLEGLADLKNKASFLSSGGSIAIHAGTFLLFLDSSEGIFFV